MALLIATAIITCFANAGAEPVYLGKGCTTLYYVDNDCDGYGPDAPNGPDADDNDPTVNTPATMLAKYGSLENFLGHLGYGHDRIFYIAKNGNNSTGEPNNPNKPYLNWNGVSGLLHENTSSDVLVWRSGTWSDSQTGSVALQYFYGSPEKRLIMMAYPGEKATIQCIKIQETSYITIDGLNLECTMHLESFSKTTTHREGSFNIALRNIVTHGGKGLHAMYWLHDILIENSVFNNTDHVGHVVYFGSGCDVDPNTGNCSLPGNCSWNYNITWRGNIMTGGGCDRSGTQHNGEVHNFVVENNIIHDNCNGGLQVMEGVSDSIIRNNLFFNNGGYDISFYEYVAPAYRCAFRDNNSNQVINNTFWRNDSGYAPIVLTDGCVGDPANMTGNVFRNNIVLSPGRLVYSYQRKYINNSTFENNIFYNTTGSQELFRVIDKIQTCEDYIKTCNAGNILECAPLATGNVFSNPLFVDAKDSYASTPEKFNFDLQPASPAVELGLANGAPSSDLHGNQRVGWPDAGAYEYYTAAFSILTNSLTEGIVGNSYSQALMAAAGTAPYSWSLDSGALPSGLALNANGAITGTPNAVETKTFTIKAVDSSQPQKEAAKQFTLHTRNTITCAVAGGNACSAQQYCDGSLLAADDTLRCCQGICRTAACPNGIKDPGENCANCPQDAPCEAGQTCQNATCVTTQPECVNLTKLMNYIGQWKRAEISMATLMEKIRRWKTGEGCA